LAPPTAVRVAVDHRDHWIAVPLDGVEHPGPEPLLLVGLLAPVGREVEPGAERLLTGAAQDRDEQFVPLFQRLEGLGQRLDHLEVDRVALALVLDGHRHDASVLLRADGTHAGDPAGRSNLNPRSAPSRFGGRRAGARATGHPVFGQPDPNRYIPGG
jgi:hypothetical protein